MVNLHKRLFLIASAAIVIITILFYFSVGETKSLYTTGGYSNYINIMELRKNTNNVEDTLNTKSEASSPYFYLTEIENKSETIDTNIMALKIRADIATLIKYDTLYSNYQEGIASWYGPGFQGRKTANGERYNMYESTPYFTAAHKSLKFGTIVKVTNTKTDKWIYVRINDRGPYVHGRVIDLNKAAKQKLMPNSGVTYVKLEIVKIVKK